MYLTHHAFYEICLIPPLILHYMFLIGTLGIFSPTGQTTCAKEMEADSCKKTSEYDK